MIDFATLKRPSKPNTALALPKGFESSASSDLTSPELSADAASVLDWLAGWLKDQPLVSDVKSDAATGQLSCVFRTKLLRFKDDVDIQVVSRPHGGSSLAVYSRSRIGHSDLGANRRRIEDVLKAVVAAHGA